MKKIVQPLVIKQSIITCDRSLFYTTIRQCARSRLFATIFIPDKFESCGNRRR